MQLETSKLLGDMREAANDIVAFSAGKSFEDFE
jgi:hypothetical protein